MKGFKVLSRIFYLGGPHHGLKGCDNEGSGQPRAETLSLHNGKERKGERACLLLGLVAGTRLLRFLFFTKFSYLDICEYCVKSVLGLRCNLTFLCLTLPNPKTEPKLNVTTALYLIAL